ncbi:hypothetical protein BDZ89DRAFT_1063621 [Hymenopellis radicata]|nr:hypothetical protein BDZ89DRAFT_1063621 [Hymenopellis radicata]
MSITLPPELVELVVEHLVGDERTLRNCALVARTWAGAAQRALFRNVVIPATSKQLERLLGHLTCLPHLQTLVRLVTIPAVPTVSHLTTLLSLLPKVASMNVDFVDVWWEGPANESFLAVIRNFLHRAPLVEVEIQGVSRLDNFQNVFDLFEGTNIKRETVDLGIPVKRMRLPSVERVRFDVGIQQERFHHWLTHHRANFTNLKQCEIVAHDAEELVRWQDVMSHHGFPPLETFKFELIYGSSQFLSCQEIPKYRRRCILRRWGISLLPALPLGGLQFQHVHLGIVVGKVRYDIVTHDDIQRYNIEWWSAIFRAISASKATVHFTKLTFTIMPPMDVTDIWSAWTGLDHSLMHPTFRNVRSIYFEKVDRWQTTLLTEAADSALTNEMRLVLPQLASRGVLCFV